MDVENYSTKFKRDQFQEKYDHLSSFMSLKAKKIREISDYALYKECSYNQIGMDLLEPKRRERNNTLLEKPSTLNKSLSYNQKSKTPKKKNLVRSRQGSFKLKNINHLGVHQHFNDNLIGTIDPMGVFQTDYHSEGIQLCSSSLTENIGFFDKLSFDSSMKAWEINIKETFNFFKALYSIIIKHKPTKQKSMLQAKLVNWGYFDRMDRGYMPAEIEFT